MAQDGYKLAGAHVSFTADFSHLTSAIKQAVKMAQDGANQIKAQLRSIEQSGTRSFRSVAGSAAQAGASIATSIVGGVRTASNAWLGFHRMFLSTMASMRMRLVFFKLDMEFMATGFKRSFLAVAAALGVMSTAAVSFESAFVMIRRVVNASESEFQQLEANVRSLSRELPLSANHLADLMGVAGRLGIEGVDNLTMFTRTIAQLSLATDIVGEESASALARFLNVMDEAVSNVDRVGSAITALGNEAAVTEMQILDMARRVAPAGRALGLTTAQVLGLSTALAQAGIRSEMGGTAISRIMIRMAEAVASNSAELHEFARVAQVSSRDFANAFRRDPVLALQMFIRGLRDVSDAGDNIWAIFEEAGFADVRVRETLLALTGSADKMTSAINLANRAWSENRALMEEVDRVLDTTGAQFRLLWNEVMEIVRSIGDQLQPVLRNLIDLGRNAASTFESMTDEQKQNIAQWTVLAAVLTGVAVGFMTVIHLILTTALSFVLITQALTMLTSPWFLGLMGLLLILGLVKQAFEQDWFSIASRFTGFIEWVRDAFNALDLGSVVEAIKSSLHEIGGIWTDDTLTFEEKIVETGGVVVRLGQFLWEWLGERFRDLWSLIQELWDRNVTQATAQVDAAGEIEVKGFSAVVVNAVRAVWGTLTGWWSSLSDWWSGYTVEVGDGEEKRVSGFKVALINAVTALWGTLSRWWATLGEWWNGYTVTAEGGEEKRVAGFKAVLVHAIESVWGTIQSWWSSLSDWWSGYDVTTGEGETKEVEGFKVRLLNAVVAAWQSLRGAVNTLSEWWNGYTVEAGDGEEKQVEGFRVRLINAVEAFWGTVSSWWASLSDWWSGYTVEVGDGETKEVEGFKVKLINAIEIVWDWLGEQWNHIKDVATSFFEQEDVVGAIQEAWDSEIRKGITLGIAVLWGLQHIPSLILRIASLAGLTPTAAVSGARWALQLGAIAVGASVLWDFAPPNVKEFITSLLGEFGRSIREAFETGELPEIDFSNVAFAEDVQEALRGFGDTLGSALGKLISGAADAAGYGAGVAAGAFALAKQTADFFIGPFIEGFWEGLKENLSDRIPQAIQDAFDYAMENLSPTVLVLTVGLSILWSIKTIASIFSALVSALVGRGLVQATGASAAGTAAQRGIAARLGTAAGLRLRQLIPLAVGLTIAWSLVPQDLREKIEGWLKGAQETLGLSNLTVGLAVYWTVSRAASILSAVTAFLVGRGIVQAGGAAGAGGAASKLGAATGFRLRGLLPFAIGLSIAWDILHGEHLLADLLRDVKAALGVEEGSGTEWVIDIGATLVLTAGARWALAALPAIGKAAAGVAGGIGTALAGAAGSGVLAALAGVGMLGGLIWLAHKSPPQDAPKVRLSSGAEAYATPELLEGFQGAYENALAAWNEYVEMRLPRLIELGVPEDRWEEQLRKGEGYRLWRELENVTSDIEKIVEALKLDELAEALLELEELISTVVAHGGLSHAAGASNEQRQAFAGKMMPLLDTILEGTGLESEAVFARMMLETGWLSSAPGRNLFGIKPGTLGAPELVVDTVSVWTTEFIGGLEVKEEALFRAYDSWTDSIYDFVALMHSDRYSSILHLPYDQQLAKMVELGYATSPATAIAIAEQARAAVGRQHGYIVPGLAGPDQYLAMIAPGEAIVPSQAVRGGWPGVLRWFQKMGVPGFYNGGFPGGMPPVSSGIPAIDEQVGATWNMAQDMRESVEQLSTSLLDSLEDLFSWLGGLFMRGIELLAELLERLFPEQAETFRDFINEIRTEWNNLWVRERREQEQESREDEDEEEPDPEPQLRPWEQLVRRVRDGWHNTLTRLRQGAESFSDFMGRSREWLGQPARERMEDVQDFIATPIMQGMDWFGSQLREASSMVADFGMNTLQAMTIVSLLGDVLRHLEVPARALIIPLTIVTAAIADALTPAFKALFPIMKFLGQIILMVATGIATVWNAITGTIGGIFRALSEISILGWKPLAFLRGTAQFFEDLQMNTKALKDAQEELADLTWEEALERARGTEALKQMNQQLRNVPTGFRVALERFRAAAVVSDDIMAAMAENAGLAAGNIFRFETAGLRPSNTLAIDRPQDGGYREPGMDGSVQEPEIHLHFHGPVYGMDDFDRRVIQATSRANRNASLASYGT